MVVSFSIEFTLNKYYTKRRWFFAHRNNVERKKYLETTRIFRQTKLGRKMYVKGQRGFFNHRNYIEKNTVDAMWIFWTAKSCRKKYVETTWIFRPSKLHQKKYVETTRIFRPSKLHRKKYVVTTRIFRPSKLRQKSTWNRRGFFDHRNYTETSMWKQLGFFDHRNYVQKLRGIDVDISTIKITSKKYVESTSKFVKIWSSTQRRNIHVESTSIWRGVPVGGLKLS